MGRKRAVKPSWFKLFGSMRSVFEAAPDEVAGRALKGALRYFDTGEVPELEPMEWLLFCALRPQMEEAYEEFYQKVAAGRRGGLAAAQAKCSTAAPCPAGYTEGEEEGEEEGEGEAEAEAEADGPFGSPEIPHESVRDAYAYFLSRVPKTGRG